MVCVYERERSLNSLPTHSVASLSSHTYIHTLSSFHLSDLFLLGCVEGLATNMPTISWFTELHVRRTSHPTGCSK